MSRSMAVDVISEFLHIGGPPLNADDAAIAIVDVLEREGFNLDRVRDARDDDEAVEDVEKLRVALEWTAARYAETLAGRSVRDADECLLHARNLLDEFARPAQPEPDALGGLPPSQPKEEQ